MCIPDDTLDVRVEILGKGHVHRGPHNLNKNVTTLNEDRLDDRVSISYVPRGEHVPESRLNVFVGSIIEFVHVFPVSSRHVDRQLKLEFVSHLRFETVKLRIDRLHT
jgi:hypothetical protein